MFLLNVPIYSEIKAKMERTNFYETLYIKALECTNSGDLIQQTA